MDVLITIISAYIIFFVILVCLFIIGIIISGILCADND